MLEARPWEGSVADGIVSLGITPNFVALSPTVWGYIIMENRQKILTSLVPPFRVTQGHMEPTLIDRLPMTSY